MSSHQTEQSINLDAPTSGTRTGSAQEAIGDRAGLTNPGQFIADPGPLGLAAFALTTFVLSVVNTGMLDTTATPVVLGLAAFYGGLAQLLAGMWEFRKANTFGALAFTSFGGFWLSFWYLQRYTVFAPTSPGNTVDHAVGVFLLAWAMFTAYMTVASLRVSGAVAAVFVALTITLTLLAIGAFATSTTVNHIGGWAGIVTAMLAWYASFAGVTNATWGRTVLPTWPLAPGTRGPGRTS